MGQVRVAKTKVRTGCRTCKDSRKRRVKCDEAKPACQRCVAGGRQCEGYEVVTPKNIPHASQRILLPGPRHGSQALVSNPSSRLPSPISPLPGVNTDEIHYFDYFSKYTAPTISGPFASPLFERFVLQLGHREPLIRHAATALGALQIAQERNGRIVLTQEEAGFALKQYGKSLNIMATMIPPKTPDAQRLALVACVLFTVFEIAQKRFAETAMHLEQGLNMLVRCRHGGQLPDGWDLTDADLSDEAAGLDSELIRTFDRLDIQSSFFRSTKPKLLSDPLEAARRTPKRFDSLEQAREFLTAFTRSIASFQHQVRAAPSPFIQDDLVRLEEVRTGIRRQLQAWNTAFRSWKLLQIPLPADAQPPKDAAARACLEAMATSSSIILETSISDGQEIVYDGFLTEFKTIVELAEVSRQHPRNFARPIALPNGGSGFHVHMSCIPSVYFVGLKCRDPVIRRRAIELLNTFTFREGLWDGPMGGRMLEHVCELEESGYDNVSSCADLPEKARLHEVLFDLADRVGGVQTYYKRRDFEGEYGSPGAWISWTDRAHVRLATLEEPISYWKCSARYHYINSQTGKCMGCGRLATKLAARGDEIGWTTCAWDQAIREQAPIDDIAIIPGLAGVSLSRSPSSSGMSSHSSSCITASKGVRGRGPPGLYRARCPPSCCPPGASEIEATIYDVAPSTFDRHFEGNATEVTQ